MRSIVDSSGLCLPITALQNISLGNHRLLLIGQGPFLHVHDVLRNSLLLTVRIFNVQTVHGIEHGPPYCRIDAPDFIPIALFGGCGIAVARLEAVKQASDPGGVELRNIVVSRTPEWTLKARHHVSGSGNVAFVLLTANNTLLSVLYASTTDDSLQVRQLAQGPKSFLYSGDICRLGVDELLVVGGSVFGHVLVWACKQKEHGSAWVSQTTHRFEGHSGSVFGVCISHSISADSEVARLVASCSDDRTICVWDVSDHERRSDDVAESSIKETTTSTGFGHEGKNNAQRLAIVSGHVSRIWDVEFLAPTEAGNNTQVYIISRGEDASCKLWSLDFTNTELHGADSAMLKLMSSDHHHSGKNMLAWSAYEDSSAVVLATGGADGRVVRRNLQLSTDAGCWSFSQSFRAIPVSLSSIVLKDYLFINAATVLALTTSGQLLQCGVSQNLSQTWEVDLSSCVTSVSRLCSNSVDGVVVFAKKEGIWISVPDKTAFFLPLQLRQPISWMSIVSVAKPTTQCLEVMILITCPSPEPAQLLCFDSAKLDYAPKTLVLRLPQTFTVTSACYSAAWDLLFLGSRGGSVVAHPLSFNASSQPALVSVNQSHGSDTVTSLQIIETIKPRRLHVLSTGRDGTFSIFEAKNGDCSGELSLDTIFKSSPPFPMSLEGATLSSVPQSDQVELSVFGFRSTEFVVWSHTNQSQLFAVGCGGSHRNWAYTLGHETDAKHAFVWTKASSFNYQRSYDNALTSVQEGGHGREIKALAINRPSLGKQWDEPVIIATGAEDTTIRLFSVHPQHALLEDRACGLKALGILSNHTTGILHLAFSHCGKYLFSSGGKGQFYTWRVNLGVPVVSLGIMLLDQMPQAPDDVDARIMCFDLLQSDPMYIIAAYSNGKVRGMEYHPGPSPGEGRFVPRTEIMYGAFCLMQVQLHPVSETQLTVLTAGTDGFLNWSLLENLSTSKCIRKQGIHQSSILAMDRVALGSICSLIVTGGDDNALGLTLLNSDDKGTSADSAVRAQTILIPKAHAAALTALKIVSHQQHRGEHHLVLISVGNDQRVKVWGIMLPAGLSRISWHDVTISRLHECWTCVADVSNVGLLLPMRRCEHSGAVAGQFVIVGVGIEILNVKLEHKDIDLLEVSAEP